MVVDFCDGCVVLIPNCNLTGHWQRTKEGGGFGAPREGGQVNPTGIIPKHCSLSPFLAGEAIGTRLNSDDVSPYPLASPLRHERFFPFEDI